MSDELSSRERMLAAINHQEPDHIPLWFNWHYEHTQLLDWDDTVNRAEAVLDMGLDDTMRINAPLSIHPDVSNRSIPPIAATRSYTKNGIRPRAR